MKQDKRLTIIYRKIVRDKEYLHDLASAGDGFKDLIKEVVRFTIAELDEKNIVELCRACGRPKEQDNPYCLYHEN